MLPIQERNNSRDLWAYVAYDTIGVLIERAENLARSGRRMTKIRTYRSQAISCPVVKTGLTTDRTATHEGIRIWDQTNPPGRGINILCIPGIESWGFSAYQEDGNEAAIRARCHNDPEYPCTSIFISGGQTASSNDAGRDDRIEILEYNKDGVATQTTIAFDLVTHKERAEHDAQLVDALAAALDSTNNDDTDGCDDTWDVTKLTELAHNLRDNWRTIAEELAARTTTPTPETGATRPSTPDVKTATGTRVHVKRCCNGCGRVLGDVNDADMYAVINGFEPPDVRTECGCITPALIPTS